MRTVPQDSSQDTSTTKLESNALLCGHREVLKEIWCFTTQSEMGRTFYDQEPSNHVATIECNRIWSWISDAHVSVLADWPTGSDRDLVLACHRLILCVL